MKSVLMMAGSLGVLALVAGCAGMPQEAAPAPAEPAPVPYEITASAVVVDPSADGAAFVRVEPVTRTILRVSADVDGDFARRDSLMRVPVDGPVAFTAQEVDGALRLTVEGGVGALVSLETGAVTFLDINGNAVVSESPDRAFSALDLEGDFYTVTQQFLSAPDEGFFGLGQHQNGVMNFQGEDVLLAQHNISIAMPVVLSTGDYAVLFDTESMVRFGDPRPYDGLDDTLVVRGEDGSEGGLTGRYYLDGELVAETREADPDYEFLPPEEFATGASVRDVFPAPLGTTSPDTVVWTGSLEALSAGTHKFRVYASNYVKVWVDGELVVDRWRQNWNPYYFNFEVAMQPGTPLDVKVEWQPNGGYFRWHHLDPMADEDRTRLTLTADASEMIDYYLIQGESMDDLVSGYRTLTGKAVMLPKWAYGFWQSRQRYTTQEELLDALQGYRDRNIPIDNIVLDWFYWPQDSWGDHEFDAERFPDPGAMVDAVHAMNAQIMISVWPKFYPTTANYQELDALGHIYRRQIEMGSLDWVYPGYANSFYDAFSKEAQAIYWRQMQEKLDVLGFDAWWMDATEPDQHSNLSYAERALRMSPTANGPGAANFNAYALMNAEAVYTGERAGTDPDERVFILTRSAFPGLQRYGAAAWSGDIVARWDDLKEQVAAGANFSMSGVPNWTFDIGGFAVEARYTNEDPDHVEEWRELNLRWFQFGAFAPVFRSHGEYPFREVYNLAPEGSEVYDALVAYDRLRYRLMPYIYTLAADTFHRDYTIMRGLVMGFEADRAAWDINDEYMFGPAFLVSPVYEFGARERDVYLPAGTDWYRLETGEKLAGGQTVTADAPLASMPVYVRAGAIVPTGPDVQYAMQETDGTVTLYVFTGADGAFSLYEDDGTSYAYERGQWQRIPFIWDEAAGTLTIGSAIGSWDGARQERTFRVRFVDGTDGGMTTTSGAFLMVPYSGEAVTVSR